MRCFLLAIATVLWLPSFLADSFAADDNFPSSLLGFVKPGMHLGIRSGQADSLVSIEIYSEEQIRIASDARTMNLEELGKKYQHVGEQAAKALAEYKASLEAQRERNSRFDFPPQGEPVVSLGEDRTVLLCTVAHVGDDYVLVSYGDENPRKQVFAKQAIARIRWATGDLRFRTAVRRNENRE